MITNNEIKQVRALLQKKYRNQFKRFVVEGSKLVGELLESDFEVEAIYVMSEMAAEWAHIEDIRVVPKAQFSRISGMNTPPGVLAVVKIPEQANPADVSGWTVVLDGVSDPGNLGTILRIADWFGIEQVVASTHSVDPYNPKVVQASMGAILRIPLFQVDVASWLERQRSNGVKLFGADMSGTSLDDVRFPSTGVLIMGSESHGISPTLNSSIDEKITIPRRGSAESLNVAVAMGIICSRLSI